MTNRFALAVVTLLLSVGGYTSTSWSNSCSNVTTHGSFDRSGIDESEYAIYAAGTFRVEGEQDESKQPYFNLTSINCEKQREDNGKLNITCKVTRASMYAEPDEPNTKLPNCSLDLDISEYSMQETARGIMTGTAESGLCYNAFLSIDRNSKRVYLSFTKTKAAYEQNVTKAGVCNSIPRTQVLVNCTSWARSRKDMKVPPRYCDFSSAGDK